MTSRQREHAAELHSAIRAVESQALTHAIIVCGERDPKYLRRYVALCERYYGADSALTIKARRLLAEALEVAELERMAAR